MSSLVSLPVGPAAAAVSTLIDQLDLARETDLIEIAYRLGRQAQIHGVELRIMRAALVDGFEWQDGEHVTIDFARAAAAAAEQRRREWLRSNQLADRIRAARVSDPDDSGWRFRSPDSYVPGGDAA